ncbi:MAG: two-component sensor histidine kinase [Rhodobacteraceae bacterium]|nr:two-component sensor histidine kinase [Paracoccaceae bacterium]
MGLAENILEAIPQPALLVNPQDRILAGNSMAQAVFGAGLVDRSLVMVIRQPSVLDALEACRKTGAVQSARYLTNDARQDVSFDMRASLLQGAGLDGVLLCFNDVSHLEQAGQMRRDFVANVSHELRTPLTALIGFIETLQGPARDDPAARARFLAIMASEADRMNPMAEQCNVALQLQMPESEVVIPGDGDQLRQVFTNLIENAIKYGGQGGIVTVTVHAAAPEAGLRGPAVRVQVADKGAGIDPVHIPRLTERFYRVDSHRSRQMGGTGLGLAIVKHIINRHRGRMRIESGLGEGTTFTVILPATG